MKEKAFFIFFKGLSIKQITQIFLEGGSPTLSHFTKRKTRKKTRKSEAKSNFSLK